MKEQKTNSPFDILYKNGTFDERKYLSLFTNLRKVSTIQLFNLQASVTKVGI